MNVAEFIAKWRPVELRERQACHEHFLDLCELVGHPKPAADDPYGTRFCFDRGAKKLGGKDGWADVWKKEYFGWEYKGKHKDLAAAYKQLNDYREDLENPPLLIVCDMDRIEIHTNFTSTKPHVETITLDDLAIPEKLRTLRAVFFDYKHFRPSTASHAITEQAARKVAEIAKALRARGIEPHESARFLDRLVFCMFAEDVGLLPKEVFAEALRAARQNPERIASRLRQLFGAMAGGGLYGNQDIRCFNGNLFNDAVVLDLQGNEIALLETVAALDWSKVEPAIFGTLFERGLDPDARAQIGAHYTSREDIETLVEPVVMTPLRREWEEIRTAVLNVVRTGKKRPTGMEKSLTTAAQKKAHIEAEILVDQFLERLATVKVLDPACGSGNFLYVTLGKLLDLEQEVLAFAGAHGIPNFIPRVDPRQLHGIEINAYAFELAQMTVWIGYLQRMIEHGMAWPTDSVLKPLDTFQCKDAILDLTDPENPREPEWPAVDFIVSNPPFLGGNRIRDGLGDTYVEALFALYEDRIPAFSDLCCYWFEKARRHIEAKKCLRAGLLATQGIRGGVNRKVLERIKESGDIFFAESDRPWVLDGANVHVSLAGFDDGTETHRELDGQPVEEINLNLTTLADLSRVRRIAANMGLSFQGPSPKAPFEIPEDRALRLLEGSGVNSRPNSDVIRPLVSAVDVTGRCRRLWTMDFGLMDLQDACRYEEPFEHLRAKVYPIRSRNRREAYARYWWRYAEPRPGLRSKLRGLGSFVVTPCHSKHRLFVREQIVVLANQATIAFSRDDDYFFGVLHSRVHEAWTRAQGTQLRERESGFRYTPTTCFETFPFPWPPGKEPAEDRRVRAISQAAQELDALRTSWRNPPEWTREEVLEFPGSADGPWARFVLDPDARGIGTVRFPRIIPKDAECAVPLKARTLTNLYNQRPTWLAQAHEKLDAAVFAAYGWDPSMTDDQLLASLLALNLQRSNEV